MSAQRDRDEVTFDDLVTMAMECLDGIEYRDLKKVLKVLSPELRITVGRGLDTYYVQERK